MGLVSAGLRFQALSQTQYANGWDGYFYLVQVKSWVETGRMHSPEASLIYPLLLFFYGFTHDYVLMYQCCTAALAGAFAAVVVWTTRSGPRAWLLGGWVLFSPHLTYFASQYPKNLLGLVLLMAFIGSLPRTATNQKPARFIFSTILLIVNYFGHRMTFGLAVVYLVAWWLFSIKTDFWRHIFSRKNLVIGGLAMGLFVVAGGLFPGLLHVADLGRLAGGWQWWLQFAPWSFISQFGRERLSWWWLMEIVVVTGLFLLALAEVLLRPRLTPQTAQYYALLSLCALLLFPFLEWSFTAAAYRFFLVFGLLVPVLVGLHRSAEGSHFRRSGDRRYGQYVVGALLGMAAFFSWKSYMPARHDPNYALFARVTSRTADRLGLTSSTEIKPELVIAHNGLAEFFTFTTGVDAMPWLPEYTIDSVRLWRIADGMHLPTVRYFAGADRAARVQALSSNYCLLPESVWQHALVQARIEGDSVYMTAATSWVNPHRQRPEWLLRNAGQQGTEPLLGAERLQFDLPL